MSFPRYPKYKASGVEWLGEVPAHWEVRATKRLFRVLGGGTPASEVPDYWDGDVAWATPADLGKMTGLELSTTQRRITAAGRDSCNTTLVPTGSILLSTRAPIGSVAIAGAPICTNQGCKSLIPAVDAYSHFYAYTLLACTVPLQLRGKGTTFLELSGEELGAFPLVLPPLAEQRAIAAFLDRETKKIDELVAEQERLIELLKEKRQAVISHAVTKGLDPAAPMKPSGVEWLGDVPAHWEVVPIGHRGRLQNGLSIGGEAFGSGDPFVTYGDVYKNARLPLVPSGLVRSSTTDQQKYGLVDGDVLFTRTSETIDDIGIAATCLQPLPRATFAGFLIRFRPHEGVLEPRYSTYLFRNEGVQGHFAGTMNLVTRASLSQGELRALPICIPPIHEQRAIAAFLDRETAKIDELVAQAESAISLLTERRSALISAAVTGQIDVRNAVPEVSA